MIKTLNRTLFFSLLVFFLRNAVLCAQPGKGAGNGTRIGVGPVLGFYSVNTKHARLPSQKMSAVIGFRRELRIDNSYKTFFLIGADYFFHGVNFRSYYFKKDSLKIYNGLYEYDYSLVIHELNLPIQIKYLFLRADNRLFSPYVALAWHLRYLLPPTVKVTRDGNLVHRDNPELRFRHYVLHRRMNSWLSVALGWQKNSLRNSKGSFFAEMNFRYGFSDYFFETDYAASSLYINSVHLNLLLGMKF